MKKLRKYTVSAKKGVTYTWYEMIGMECPVCHKQGWCSINEQQTEVVCMRAVNNQPNALKRFGGYVYKLDSEASNFTSEMKKTEDIPQSDYAKPNVLHKVYTIVANLLGLDPKDFNHLKNERGLSKEEIVLRGYFSTRKENLRKQINFFRTGTKWERLFKENNLPKDAWKGVPGFYWDKERKCPVFEPKEGFAIPCRNAFGQIIGAQIRVCNQSFFIKKSDESQELYKKNYVNLSIKYGKPFYRIENKLTQVCQENYFDGKKISYDGITYDVSSSPKYLSVSSNGKYLGCQAVSLPHYSLLKYEVFL